MSTLAPPPPTRATRATTPRPPARRLSARLGNLLLNLAAVAGAICILLVILAFFFNITLIMFKTGSMAPTIPAGSVALVREVPAAELKVGDVVTVDRPGQLPITHRITSIIPGPDAEARTITMRGDANATEDPAPYTILHARIVLGSVPGLAHVIVWFGNPWVLGGLTIALSALVTWAFWPRNTAPPRRRGRHGAGIGSRVGTGSAALAVALVLGGSLLAPASPVRAEGATEQTLTARTFTLVSVADSYRMANLTPGEPVTWDLGVQSNSTEPLSVSMTASGESRLGLVAGITECDERWQNNTCRGGSKNIAAPSPLTLDGVQRPLSDVPAGNTRWFRMTVTMPGAPDQALATTATSRVILRVSDPGGAVIEVPSEPGPGTTPSGPQGSPPIPPDTADGSLSHTGATLDPSRLWLALLAIGSGILIAGVARLRRERSES